MGRKRELPVWDERERPTTRLIDIHEPERDYAVLTAGDTEQNADYLAWINGYKEPLHDVLRTAHPATIERLGRRGIELTQITAAVAEITSQPAYPAERIVTASDVRSVPAYLDAIEDGFFELDMPFGKAGESYGQFEYIMHFIRLRESYLNTAPESDVVDTIAHCLGHAALCHETYVTIKRDQNVVYHWFGYDWRYNDKYYGQLLGVASAAKIAAITRAELGLDTEGTASVNPIVEQYRESRGYSFAAVGAIALDLINRQAGHEDTLGIYRPLWQFIANNQDEAARQELADSIRRATNNTLALEEIEAQPYRAKGLSLTYLKRIEEMCELDKAERPSHVLRARDFY